VGYINLNSFTEDCAKEFRYALIDLKKQGIKNLVLDLRGNGGGSLSEAVKIVNMFVPKGKTVVTTKGKIARAKSEYKTTVEPIDTITPMVVLVNGETASASEITSGALQDYKRATILGTKTFGKGLVQVPIDLPYNGQLKLTTSKYYLPSGRCVQGTGVVPDLEVKADSLPNIVFYLSASGVDSTEVMFEYVKDYLQKHPTIAPAKDFDLTDEEYDEFKQRVLTSGFTYDPQSAKVMKELKKIMEFEGYYDDAKTEFEQLEKKLQHNLARDLDRHKKIIKQAIVADIVAAYYYQRGIVQVALRNDRQYEEALKFFNNKK
jgi:carboxyl-terminal processing protease